MVQVIEFTPTGKRTKEIPSEELQKYADMGNSDAKLAIAKDKIAKAASLQEEVDAIKEMLGL